jgi:Ran GTPase-activating protein (RanGAP) involved in mRNA processing and transport
MMSPPSGFRGETATSTAAGSTTSSTNSHPYVAVSAAADLVGGCGTNGSSFMKNSIPSTYQPNGYGNISTTTKFGTTPTSTCTYGYHPSAATTTSGGAGASSIVVGLSTRYPSQSVEEQNQSDIDGSVPLDGSSSSINITGNNNNNNSAMNPTLIASSSPYDNFHAFTTSNVMDTRDGDPVFTSFRPSADGSTMSSRSCATAAAATKSSTASGGGYDERRRPTRESVLRRLSEALMRRSLTTIDMSQRDLKPSDANLIKLALLQNQRLHTLKLGYNHLGDEGLITLSSALASSTSITSLDLGFTGVGDAGLEALANNISLSTRSSSSSFNQHVMLPLQTLYLAGNAIGTRGALALARIIQFRCCHLRTLHLTGNKIGVDGIRSLTRALAAISSSSSTSSSSSSIVPPSYPIEGGLSSLQAAATGGIEELFLGGTGLGSEGCHAVSEMLSYTPSLRVLSLADNNLGDREVTILADAIKENRLRLPLEALQLSFNRLTCIGVESLMNAVWGSTTLLELRLDNNHIGDRGAQLVSVVIATVRSLQRVDLGFNSFSATGIRSLMKSVSESTNLSSLSISGNKLDASGAKAVAYALAYNTSLKYFFMDNCAASHESQRHITAGIVSNSDVKLLAVTGFRIGGTSSLQ